MHSRTLLCVLVVLALSQTALTCAPNDIDIESPTFKVETFGFDLIFGNLMVRAGIQPEIREGILFGRLEAVYQRYLLGGR